MTPSRVVQEWVAAQRTPKLSYQRPEKGERVTQHRGGGRIGRSRWCCSVDGGCVTARPAKTLVWCTDSNLEQLAYPSSHLYLSSSNQCK